MTFATSDGVRLEGRLLAPAEPRGAAVVCHPHPLLQGSMSSLLVPMIQRALAAAGWAALRFNFRGVGRSEGRFEEGRGEQRDVRAALDFLEARFPDKPLAAAGWSFGSLVSLAAGAGDSRVRVFVAVAPPVRVQDEDAALDRYGIPRIPIQPVPERLAGWDVRALAIIGDRDEFTTPDRVRAWAEETLPQRMAVEVFEDADHVFNGRQHELADRVAAFVSER